MTKIFNIGFSKSGTTSFETAMEILGYNAYKGHYNLKHNDYLMALWINKDFDEIKKMSTYWDTFSDAPWGGTDLYKKFYEWYPDAKFIYTTRDPEDWYNSLYKMLTKFDNNPKTALDSFHFNKRYGFSYFMKHNFNITTLESNKEKIISQYNEHYNEAISYLTEKKAPLLVFNSVGDDGWNELCPFLGKKIPNQSYPHSNKSTSNTPLPKSFISKLKNKLKSFIK